MLPRYYFYWPCPTCGFENTHLDSPYCNSCKRGPYEPLWSKGYREAEVYQEQSKDPSQAKVETKAPSSSNPLDDEFEAFLDVEDAHRNVYKMTALLDSGSDVHVMSRLKAESLGIPIKQYRGPPIEAFDGSRAEIYGQITTDWKKHDPNRPNPWYTDTFLVLANSRASHGYDVILGRTRIKDCNLDPDVPKRVLGWFKKKQSKDEKAKEKQVEQTYNDATSLQTNAQVDSALHKLAIPWEKDKYGRLCRQIYRGGVFVGYEFAGRWRKDQYRRVYREIRDGNCNFIRYDYQ